MANVKVRLLTSIAGENYAHNAGDEVTLDSTEAKRFLEAGLAEAVATRTAAKAEKRVVKKTETR